MNDKRAGGNIIACCSVSPALRLCGQTKKESAQLVIFSSIQYLIFLPVMVFLYWRTRGFARLALVVAASYYFYMSWLPIYGILLLIMTTLNWALGIALEKNIAAHQERTVAAKWMLGSGVVLNLACLCYYKYTNFFLANAVDGLKFFGSTLHVEGLASIKAPVLDIILPLGISFFVFEFIHYLVDVYRGSKSVGSWAEFAAFTAFFPSQIAGPIKRYQEFVENLRAPLPWSPQLFNEAMTLIVQGMFKKVAIADPLGWVITNSYASLTPISSTDALLAFFGFSIQIFCDFSGYTDIGRGSALLLGIRLPINFSLPYLSEDLAIFWRRWHISLSTWIRDYVYISMGGSRGTQFQNARNLFLTMAICGLWHGAAWQFILWGCMHGVGLIINREWKSVIEKVPALKSIAGTLPVKILNVCLTFLFVAAAFVMFRAPDLTTTWNIFSSLGNVHLPTQTLEYLDKSGVVIFGLVYVGFWLLTDALKKWRGVTNLETPIYPLALRMASWTAAVLIIIAAKPTKATPFIYFQF